MKQTIRVLCGLLALVGIGACSVLGSQSTQPPRTLNPSSVQPDCSDLINYDPASDQAQELADEVVAASLRQWPTEYMGFEQLWHVVQLGDVVMVEGLVTEEEADVIVMVRSPEGMQITARITSHSLIGSRNDLIREIIRQDPSVPAEMLACAQFQEFLAAAQQ